MKPSQPIAHQPYLDVQAYVTKDRSTIRELMCPARHGNQAQSLAEAIVPAGKRTLLHRHLSSEEIYFIVRGEGLMTLGDTSFPVRAGDTICIPPGTPHAITAGPRQRLRILCACSPAYSHDDTELLEPEPVVVPRAPRPPRVRAGRPPTAKHVGAPIALNMQSGANFKAVRDSLGLGQAAFWKRVFVTQSGGSRYESGRNVPRSVMTLLRLVYTSPGDAEAFLARLRAPYQALPPVRVKLYRDARSGADLKALRKALGINQATFWDGLQATQSGGSRYESGRNIPASIRALVILVFGTEAHARQQLETLRDPASGKVGKPRPPKAPAARP
ncbi:cupin domain-containing protein [Zoogloea sp.]|uniref:cupin domain-containing protein n=1 Tax=Zoogloea sp. TaxID=49181 RepID=UPI002FDF7DDD